MAAQLPDLITLHTEVMDLYSNPLEEYWVKYTKRKPEFQSSSTCKRGYVASWKIFDSQLLLTDLHGEYMRSNLLFGKRKSQLTLQTIFPKASLQGVLANWFSGKLRVPTGQMTQYEHCDYNSRFEKEIIITIEKGVVLKMVTLDYTQKKLVVNMEKFL